MTSTPRLQMAYDLLRSDPAAPPATSPAFFARAAWIADLLVIDLFEPAQSDICNSCWRAFSNGERGKSICSGDCALAY